MKYVINYDYPNNSEDYVHRIGRTGRLNNIGTAYTFFTPSNSPKVNDLINVLREASQIINPELIEMSKNSYGRSMLIYIFLKLINSWLILRLLSFFNQQREICVNLRD